MLEDILSKIRREDIIRLTQQLIRIPTVNPPGNEEDLSNFLIEEMKGLGFKVESYEVRPKRPNVIGVLSGKGGGGRRVMFNGHLDVVPVGDLSRWESDPFGGELRDGRIYGRGSTDMKGGIASMIVAAKAFADASEEFRGEIIFTGVVDEESEGLGTQSIVERGYGADMAMVGEPSDDTICRAHKGNLWFEVVTHGRSEHSSQVASTKEHANAIYRMARVVRMIEGMLPELEERRDDLVGNPTISVGEIEGGTKPNIIPDRCRIAVDRRLLPGEDPSKVLEEIRARLLQLSRDDPEFRADLRILISREGARISPSEEIIAIASKAVREVLSSTPRVGGMRATTDMAFLVNGARIPTIIYGPGSISEAHTVNEFVEVDQLVNSSRVYAAILSSALLE